MNFATSFTHYLFRALKEKDGRYTFYMTYLNVWRTWKLMASRMGSGWLSSTSSMMNIRWYGSCWNSVCRISWSWKSTVATVPSTCYINMLCIARLHGSLEVPTFWKMFNNKNFKSYQKFCQFCNCGSQNNFDIFILGLAVWVSRDPLTVAYDQQKGLFLSQILTALVRPHHILNPSLNKQVHSLIANQWLPGIT